jgi:hypothetical protein
MNKVIVVIIMALITVIVFDLMKPRDNKIDRVREQSLIMCDKTGGEYFYDDQGYIWCVLPQGKVYK